MGGSGLLTERQQRVAQQRGRRAAQVVGHKGGVLAAQPARQQVLHREPGRVELGGREHEAHGEHQVGQREGDLRAVHRAAAAARKPSGRGPQPPTENRREISEPVGDGRWAPGGRWALWEMVSPPAGPSGRWDPVGRPAWGALGDVTSTQGTLGNGVALPRTQLEAVKPPQSPRGFGSISRPVLGAALQLVPFYNWEN